LYVQNQSMNGHLEHRRSDAMSPTDDVVDHSRLLKPSSENRPNRVSFNDNLPGAHAPFTSTPTVHGQTPPPQSVDVNGADATQDTVWV
jgi:hypothetical protein